MRKCSKCGNLLSPAEGFNGSDICDLCLVTTRLQEKKRMAMLKNIEDIPPEYRGKTEAQAIIDVLNKRGGGKSIWEINIYATGTRDVMSKMKWSIAEHIWRNAHSARVVNFLSWTHEYSCLGQDKWEKLSETISFNGYLIIDADTLLCDQSLLYVIIQGRKDKGRYTCVITNFSRKEEETRTISHDISGFIGDKVNKYLKADLY